MSEFKEAVESFKQAFVADDENHGFTTPIDKEEATKPADIMKENDPPEDMADNYEDAPSTPEGRQRKKNLNPYKKRIHQLVDEKGKAEQNSFFLAQELANRESMLAQKEAQLYEMRNQLQQKDQHTNAYYENTLLTREQAIKQELRKAKEDGDIDKEVELEDALAEVKAEKSTFKFYQNQESQRVQKYEEEEPYVPYQQAPIQTPHPLSPPNPVNEHFEDWVQDNHWYNSNPKLRSEADHYANELADVLSFNDQAHLIGTPDFYKSVTNIMRERYGNNGAGERQRSPSPEPQYQSPSNYSAYDYEPDVAPVTRRGASMADQYMSRQGGNGVSLTPDELEVARHLARKLPDGRIITTEEAIKRYKDAKRYPSSRRPNASEHALTIL